MSEHHTSSAHPEGVATEWTAAHRPDWPAIERETVALLQELIRFRTVNPPGDELPLARHLHALLEFDGIRADLLETTPGRAAVVARLSASRAVRERATDEPLLLLAHMDVVGVEADRWTADPFGGELRDGCLYGRGAIDDKGMLATLLMTMLLLKRHVVDEGGALSRDVVLVATPDEEAGSDWGLAWLQAHHPELVRGAFALNEGGRIRIEDGRPAYAAIQTSEKVPHLVRVVARGPSGHASVPRQDNALLRLARAVAAIGAHAEPLRLTDVTATFLLQLAPHTADRALADAMAVVAAGTTDGAALQAAERAIAAHPMLDAVVRTGISPVRIGGGVRDNVIPALADAVLNVRTLPGESIHDVVARLRAVVDDASVELTAVAIGEDAPPSPVDSPLYQALAASLQAEYPGITVVPYLSTGATDNARLRRAGVPAYGLLPFALAPEDEARMHGHDERVPLRSLHAGLRIVLGATARVAVRHGPAWLLGGGRRQPG